MHFFIISRSFLLGIRNVSDERCRGNLNTHFEFSKFFFFENRAVYGIMWKHIVERGRPQMTIWRKLIASCIHKSANTHTQFVQYSLFFHYNNGCTKTAQSHVIRTLSVFGLRVWSVSVSTWILFLFFKRWIIRLYIRLSQHSGEMKKI